MIGDDDIDRECSCPCRKRRCVDCPKGFEKVMDLKGTGLVIYRQSTKPENNIGITSKADVNGLIFHNTKDEDIISKDFLLEMDEKSLKCTRCRQIMEHAKNILFKVSAINKQEIIGLCDHCKLRVHSCDECEESLQMFVDNRIKANEVALTKEKVRDWLQNIKNEFKEYLVDDKESEKELLKDYIKSFKHTDKKLLRAHSETSITRLCQQRQERSKHEIEVRELCRELVEQNLAISTPDLTAKNKKQIIFSFDNPLDIQGSSFTVPSDRKTKSTVKKTKRSDSFEDDIITQQPPIKYTHGTEKQTLYEEKPSDEESLTDFIFSFPFERKREEKHSQQKSSSELISDIYDKIRERNEETQRKNEEIRLKKIEEQENKQRMRQEKLKLVEEKKRLAEEKKVMEKKELSDNKKIFDKHKDMISLKDKISKSKLSTATVEKKKNLMSEADQDETKSKPKLRESKSETTKESKTKVKEIKSEPKLSSKKHELRHDEETKHPKYKSDGDLNKSGADIKQSKGQKELKADSKSYSNQEKVKSEPRAELKPDSRKTKDGFGEKKEKLKSDSKQSKAEVESKQFKNDTKGEKPEGKESRTGYAVDTRQKSVHESTKSTPKDETEPKKALLAHTGTKSELHQSAPESKNLKADSKDPNIEPKQFKADSKQTKAESMEPKEEIKQPKAESKKNKTEPNVEVKQFKTEQKKLKADQSKIDQIDFKLKTGSKEPSDSKGTKDVSKSEKGLEKPSKEKDKKDKTETPKAEKNVAKTNKAKDSTKEDEITIRMEGDDAPKRKNVDTTFTSQKAKEKGEFRGKQMKDVKQKSPDEPRIPRRQLEAQLAAAKEAEKQPKKEKKGAQEKQIKMLELSQNTLALELVQIKRTLSQIMTPSQIRIHETKHKGTKDSRCPMCINSNLELEYESRKKKKLEQGEIIKGHEIKSIKHHKEEKEGKGKQPILFHLKYDDKFVAEIIAPPKHIPVVREYQEEKKPVLTSHSEESKGVIHYALSDRTFIEKGWTMLPTEKVVRKMNVYRMRPAHPEFDWFKNNRKKGLMTYDTGERLAEFDDDGHGRWFYRNQRLALQYYDAEELNAQQRFVIYSNGEPDERGRTRPYTVLAMFDYLGNGIVFDHSGKIRLKYNQTEGVVLDKNIGPVTHWKWHTLNDPPVLQQVMIDTQMSHKDPQILKMGTAQDKQPRPDNEEMLSIEFDNFIKEKSKKLTQKFKPFQIKMKAMKINENFSLKVLDQANVYLIYRDGTTNIKLNLGMLLDHKEIVDTDTAEVGEVANNMERLPALTDSLAAMQKSVAYAQHFERNRTERERRLRPPEPNASADKLVSAVSRPIRIPLIAAYSSTTPSSCTKSRKPSTNNIYYNNRFL